MSVRELIEHCGRNEPEAWAELWEVVASAALFPIRRLLQRQGFGLELADDALQELYVYLREDDLQHLRAFRGDSIPQFRAYLRTLAIHFTLNLIRRIKRVQRLEAEALRSASLPDRTGPTEHQIELALRELESLMSETERVQLRCALEAGEELEPGERAELSSAARSLRTYRRWRETLYRKYGSNLS
jgi:DNA-directed RNA polymerase specialized sigma24 family protein